MATRWRDLSGDSTARNIVQQDGCVTFDFDDFDSDATLRVTIYTDTAIIRDGTRAHPVMPRLLNGRDTLDVDKSSGLFVAPPAFSSQMDMSKSGAHLLIGRHAMEWPSVFQLVGYKVHLICPVQSEASIVVTQH